MASAYVRELSIGEIMRSALQLYKRSFGPSVLAYAIPNLPGALLYVFGTAVKSVPLIVIAFLFFFAGSFVSYTAITLCVSDACVGNPPSLKRSMARTRKVGAKLISVYLLQVLIIAGGVVALIIPGFIFALWFLFAPIVVVLEGRKADAALRRSRALGKGFFWRNLAVLLLLIIVISGLFLFVFVLIGLLAVGLSRTGTSATTLHVLGFLLGTALGWLIYPFIFVTLVVTYYDLRARKEAYDSVALTAELAR